MATGDCNNNHPAPLNKEWKHLIYSTLFDCEIFCEHTIRVCLKHWWKSRWVLGVNSWLNHLHNIQEDFLTIPHYRTAAAQRHLQDVWCERLSGVYCVGHSKKQIWVFPKPVCGRFTVPLFQGSLPYPQFSVSAGEQPLCHYPREYFGKLEYS